ncbi:MAG: Npt1/Npt2 family nucleotide transporter [Bryobacteraceae bacterium]
MNRLRIFWRGVFDVRPGEYMKTTCMTLYLMLVLFAYYIIKPVSRAIFLDRFNIDKLPWLYILIALVGGVLAFFYTRLAVKASLKTAVNFATVFSIVVLVAFWWLIRLNIGWIVYAFNIWVSLFSVSLVAQGWLIAANIFTPREAKRLYGILGVGSVIGAAFGGSFTAFMVRIIGTTNLILASAGMVVLSYIPFAVMVSKMNVALKSAKGGDEEEEFSFGEILGALRTHRHLQVIMGIMVLTFVIDVMVEFQFNAQAKLAYHNKADLTAFLGNFYGFYLNLATFIFQFFLTGWIVSRFGVGGTLQIMPISIALASIAALISPDVLSTAATRLTEASTRYSFNKTGMELLYLPLPLELRNRTKAFIDIFVDRMSRGIGGMILVLTTSVFALAIRDVAAIVMFFSVVWIFLSIVAKREYIATVRNRLDTRRLSFENARITVDDPETLRVLAETALSRGPRQAAYALSVLEGIDVNRWRSMVPLERLLESPAPEVRAMVYDVAMKSSLPDYREKAFEEIRSARGDSPAVRAAVLYVLKVSDERPQLAARLLEHPNPAVAEAAILSVVDQPELAKEIVTGDWLERTARDPDPARRRLAAIAARICGEEGAAILNDLLNDEDRNVVAAAFLTAAALKNREYLPIILRRLGDVRLRGAAVEALAAYGPLIVGSLSDLMQDESVSLAVRLQIPRVLRLIPNQRSVTALLDFIAHSNLALRGAALRALNRLRESAPDLDYGSIPVSQRVLDEAKYYFQMNAALIAFQEYGKPQTPAGLLVNTLQHRLEESLDRLFRLLGLKYPPLQIYAAFLAIHRGSHDDTAAALEFLDTVLEKDLKRIVMPLLEDTANAQTRGHDLFNIDVPDIETAVRELINTGDEWLASCAIATAAQLSLRNLAADIHLAGERSGGDICQVARDSALALA